jgi:DNA ligase (NAD+)
MPKNLSKAEIKRRIEKLRKLINYHRYLYHVLDHQEISEAALDSLKKEFFDFQILSNEISFNSF